MDVLEYATGREVPVGPPWITTSSGYFLPGTNPTGLCRTPSIVVPSWLFHDTTSMVPFGHFAVWAVMSVSFRGFSTAATGDTYTSAIVPASLAVYATVRPSGVRLNADPMNASAGVYFRT